MKLPSAPKRPISTGVKIGFGLLGIYNVVFANQPIHGLLEWILMILMHIMDKIDDAVDEIKHQVFAAGLATVMSQLRDYRRAERNLSRKIFASITPDDEPKEPKP